MTQRWARMALLGLVPSLLFLALHLRTLDYELVWTDVPELVHGSILRPAGEILPAFGEPLHRPGTGGYATRGFTQPYYRPLQVVTASGLDVAFGREPRVFRSATLALGALTAALLAGFAALLLRSTPAGALAGCLFAAHPATLEIYVWTGGLSAAWVGIWIVASCALALAALRSPGTAAAGGFAVASVAAAALGLLSKENAAVLPGLVLVLGLAQAAEARRRGEPRAPWMASAALVAMHAALVAAYLLVLRPAILGASLTGSPPLEGSFVTQWASSLAHWPQDFAWLVAPLESNTSDAIRIVRTLADPATGLGAALALGSASLAGFWLWRGHAAPAFALAWIWITFLPTSGLAPLLHPRAERNLFLPMLGLALLWPQLGGWLGRRGVPSAALALAAVVGVAALAQRTWVRQPDWRSTVTLFESDVARDPRHREGRLNLAVTYAEAGRFGEAKAQSDALLDQLAPTAWTSYALPASILEVACRVNAAVGADAETAALSTNAIASNVWAMPGFHACRAESYEKLGRHADALPVYEALHAGAPAAEGAGFALGAARCQLALGDAARAKAWLDRIGPAARPEIRRAARALERRLGPAPR